jgi:ABC-type transport system involved in cytochrome bd biosynthesis fused ATPase/permease subunit
MTNEISADSTAQKNQIEITRINRAFQLSIFGLLLAASLVVVLLFSGSGQRSASDITAIVGLFTSVLGTLIGAFFGLQIGAADKAKAEQRADSVQKKVDALQSAANPDTIKKAQSLYPNLFK